MNPTPRVLILGANGRFGAAATQAFAAAGWQVLAQMRRAPVLPQTPGVQPVPIALADTAALVAAAAGAQAVVYAVNPLYTRWDTDALPLLEQGMAVAKALNATFMLPGNVYNFGAQMPALLREDTPQRPSTGKGRIRHDMEEALRAQAAQGLRSVVIRAGDFFGAGTGSWLDQVVVKSLAQGKLVYPGPLDRAHAWAYLPDLAQTFVAVAARSADLPAFATLHFEGHTVTGAELLAAVERAASSLGLAPKRGWRHGSMPWGLIRAVGLVRPLWRELARMAYLWDVPHRLDGSALRALLGSPPPSTPLDVALQGAMLALGLGAQRQEAALLAVRTG